MKVSSCACTCACTCSKNLQPDQSTQTTLTELSFRADSYYNWTVRSDDDERHIDGHTAVSDYRVTLFRNRMLLLTPQGWGAHDTHFYVTEVELYPARYSPTVQATQYFGWTTRELTHTIRHTHTSTGRNASEDSARSIPAPFPFLGTATHAATRRNYTPSPFRSSVFRLSSLACDLHSLGRRIVHRVVRVVDHDGVLLCPSALTRRQLGLLHRTAHRVAHGA